MSVEDLYIGFNITTAPRGNKHHRAGWLNVSCPHCTGTAGYHLGFNTDANYYYCFRCGYHKIVPTISKLLNVSESAAYGIAKEYDVFVETTHRKSAKDDRIGRLPYLRPSDVHPLQSVHKRYLERRGFDPDMLVKEFGLMATGPISMLDIEEYSISYKHRIFIPILWRGKEVSFQTRDYTGKQELRYSACPMARELIHHKHIIFGKESKWSDVGLCVEGVFDVFRFVVNTFATLGIGYTRKQVDVMAQRFKRIFVLFDPDSQAQIQARKLRKDLAMRGVETEALTLDTDPGDMNQSDANHLIADIFKKLYLV